MVGPVFALELIRSSRRGGQHRFRWVYAAWLLLQFGFFAYTLFVTYVVRSAFLTTGPGHPSSGSAGSLVTTYLTLFVGQQLLLFLLAAPAFAAGAITEEKMRRTLDDLLTTWLSAWEIVAGKLLAAVVRVLDLSLPGWLILCFLAGVCSLEPVLLLALVIGVLAPLPALAAAGVLASVWCRRTPSAVFLAYLLAAGGFGVLCTLGLALPWLHPLNAPDLLAQQATPRPLLVGLLGPALGWAGLGLVFLAVAVWRLRPAYQRQMVAGTGRSRPGRRWSARPAVSDQPLRWKEENIEGLGRLPVVRCLPRGLILGCLGGLSFGVFGLALLAAWESRNGGWFAGPGLAVAFLFSLAVGVRSAATITSERERQTWEALLLTPLDARQLIRAKVWGIIHSARPFLLAFMIPAVLLALPAGPLAVAWVLACWGAAWILMYYFGACGVRCSAQGKTSWKSLLATFGLGSRDLFVRFLVFGLPVGSIIGALVTAVFLNLGRQGLLAGYWILSIVSWSILFMTGVFLFVRTEELFQEAEKWLAQNERILDYPRYRPKAPPPREPVSAR
jgi:ABC-type transport system involved in multi-copper enzyme maturation permease subunit